VLASGASRCNSRKKLSGAVKVAVDDQRIDFGVCEPRQGALRFALDGDIHVQTAENTFQNTDFLPIARNYHRGECHEFTLPTAVMAT